MIGLGWLNGFALPSEETDHTQRQYSQRGKLISRDRPRNARLSPKELMKKSERPIPYQIQMEVLSRKQVASTQEKEPADCSKIKRHFHRYCRPAVDAGRILQREPRWRTFDSLTTPLRQTTNASQDDSQRDDQRKPIACGSRIPKSALGNFDGGVTAKQTAQNALAGRQPRPRIRTPPVHPSFRQEIDRLGAKESAKQRGNINPKEAVIAPRQARPEASTDHYAGQHKPPVRGYFHGADLVSGKLE